MPENIALTARARVEQLALVYDRLITSGENTPVLIPWVFLGIAIVPLYLILDTSQSSQSLLVRFSIWSATAALMTHNILFVRARNPAVTYAVGLMSAWMILWSAALLLAKDPRRDFARIRRRDVDSKSASESRSPVEGETNVSNVRQKQVFWQYYPRESLLERIDWVSDLYNNFRGVGWNWRVSGLPALPAEIQADLGKETLPRTAALAKYRRKGEAYDLQNRSALLRHTLWIAVRDYIIIDILRAIAVADPYFWGVLDAPAPIYLSALLRSNAFVVKSTRLLLELAAMSFALEYVMTIGPLLLVGVLGPGGITNTRGEPWMYPDIFGSFDAVFEKGLAGWWAGWWHQVFRYGFEAPSKKIIALLGMDHRTSLARTLQLVIVFGLSGTIHACGSYTQLGQTATLSGPFRFFMSQVIGIGAQMVVVDLLRRSGITPRCPRWLSRIANFVYVHVWFYHTAPWLTNDLSKGGLWLYEPLPVSIVRGLGFGTAEQIWIPWSSDAIWWHDGGHWWNSGWAI